MSRTVLPLKGDETPEEEQVLKMKREWFHFSRGAGLWTYTVSTGAAESFGGAHPIDAYRAAVAIRGDKV